MKLQISFDEIQLDQNIEEARTIAQFADILEIGTLPILKWGAKAVETVRAEFPEKILFADSKKNDSREKSEIKTFAGTMSIVQVKSHFIKYPFPFSLSFLYTSSH